jgi:tripartite-type tricarboxylate transporter receptor subunit TctC
MVTRRSAAALLALFGSVWLGATVARADIPCRTAKLIVPWAPGGGTAIIFELIADAINRTGIKPRLQVVTIPGQGGNKGAKVARRAKPDGCSLFAIHQSAITSYLSGRVDFTWDAFEPVAMLTSSPSIIGANRSVPYDDLAGLVAAAESAPGKVLAGATLGSNSHYFLLLVQQAAGIELKYVSYEGTRQRLTALLAETIDLGEINVVAARQYIMDDELKALGIARCGFGDGARGGASQGRARRDRRVLRTGVPERDGERRAQAPARGQGHRGPGADQRGVPAPPRGDLRHPQIRRYRGRHVRGPLGLLPLAAWAASTKIR